MKEGKEDTSGTPKVFFTSSNAALSEASFPASAANMCESGTYNRVRSVPVVVRLGW